MDTFVRQGGTESPSTFELQFIIIIFLSRAQSRVRAGHIVQRLYSTYSRFLVRPTQFLLTFLLSYVRVTNGQVKFSVSASIYNIRVLYRAFEEDQALHTCVTSQGNFLPPSPHRNIVI